MIVVTIDHTQKVVVGVAQGIVIVIVMETPEVISQIDIGIDLGISIIIIMVVGMVLEIILVRGIDSPQVIDIRVMRLMLVIQDISRLITGLAVHMKLNVITVIDQVILPRNALTLDAMHVVKESHS